jgi:hypothetical protein
MYRTLATILAALLIAFPTVAADNSKDKEKDKEKATSKPDAKESAAVTKAKQKLADTKIAPADCDFKDEPLESVLKKLLKESDAQLSFYFDNGVARHKSMTYTLKEEKPLKDVLDELFKKDGLGYVIHRKDKEADRYEGWLQIRLSNERGDEGSGKDPKKETKPAKGATPDKGSATTEKPSKPSEVGDEDRATAKLKRAKTFVEMGLKDDAKEYCEEIMKKYPKTKAAEEAKELLEKLK